MLRTLRLPTMLATPAIAFLAAGQLHGDSQASAAAQRAKLRTFFQGMKIYESQCLPCHGEKGRGDGPWAEGLAPKPRDFRSGIFKFRSTPYGKLPTNDDLRRTITVGISGTAMPSFKSMSEDDINAVIHYVRSFSVRWNKEEHRAEPLTLPKTPEWFSNEEELARRAKSGAGRFAQLCAVCHGAEGKGNGAAAKGLVDAWSQPVPPADLTAAHHKSGNAPADLYRTIATGLDGTPMLGFAEILKEDEIWELIAYIKSKEIPEAQGGP
ncbi:c-type cytochrome [Haloferula chungangensis]|uniref:C-type cytochrome n=1 Tax=Haloferula chungangensis TaxID=1048331 RepID=A0ABW2LDG7_9BACT